MTAWRANPSGRYWFVGTDLKVYPEADAYDVIDNSRYDAGNYFATRTEATKIAKWIYAGIRYIRGDHMDRAIERWIEAKRIVEKIDALRRTA